ncbi:DoxX family protein [Paenibacillus sp. PR3]|uniref:DoxX family protein n=1 Tax=Paenibacillus terricola TaxID=2763503 RepID=A0ABR8MR39_9BACL|nr:DoxX family protein [Paenibacillus terricola]MBD3918437.1 DoxX family protein [Paenibacillus terricola]
MNIVFLILQSFLLVAMGFGGVTKITGSKNWVDIFDSLKLPQWFRVVTGVVQIAGAVGLVIGYWNRDIAAWAGIWLGITMLVAFLLHFRVKHPIGQAAPALLLTVISAALVLIQA